MTHNCPTCGRFSNVIPTKLEDTEKWGYPQYVTVLRGCHDFGEDTPFVVCRCWNCKTWFPSRTKAGKGVIC